MANLPSFTSTIRKIMEKEVEKVFINQIQENYLSYKQNKIKSWKGNKKLTSLRASHDLKRSRLFDQKLKEKTKRKYPHIYSSAVKNDLNPQTNYLEFNLFYLLIYIYI